MDTRQIRTRYSELTSRIIDARSQEKSRLESEIIGLISVNREYAVEYFSTILSRALRIHARSISMQFDAKYLAVVVFDDNTLGIAISILNTFDLEKDNLEGEWLDISKNIVDFRNLSGVIRYISVNGVIAQ